MRLFLLDGTALAYRAHFALVGSRLAKADGTPTGATYGFTMTLRRILEEEEPDLVAVALDAKGPTFRHERYPDYKATRERAPEEMVAQLGLIRRVIEAHGVPLFEVPGVEADDVIGTLAKQAERAGHEVFIVTGDKDFMQLVSEHVKLYNVFKQGEPPEIQGLGAVREKFGTDPAHVIDVLAIMGDSSDNVPGVHGIGPKGAIELIQQFGSVDGLLAHLPEVREKTRAKIEASREMLLLSRELVTIHTAVPLAEGLSALKRPAPDAQALIELFRELEFGTLLEKVASQTHVPSRSGPRDYVTVTTRGALEAMSAELRAAGSFALDTETTGLFPLDSELVGISLSAAAGRAFYVPVKPAVFAEGNAALFAALTPLLCDPALARFGQNTKFDWLVLAHAGLRLPPPAFDTLVASFCVAGGDARTHGLDALALRHFGIKKIATAELLGKGKTMLTMDQVPLEKVAEYACEDADFAFRLRAPLEQELAEAGATKLFHELELPLVPVLAAMEERGIRLDVELIARLSGEMEKELLELTHAVQGHAGENFNVNSTKALGEILFEKLRIQDQAGVKKVKKTQTGWATDADTLSLQYGDVPIVKTLLEYREVQKLKSTYTDALPAYVNQVTGRIHCSFSQVNAATGRLASSDPNLQNIPIRSARGRRLRAAFVPRLSDAHGEWLLVSADYSQIELRVMAHLSGDEHMRRTFERGEDVHAATAARVFGIMPELVTREMRDKAKVINFGLLYGMGPQRVARETGMPLAEAKTFVERYFASFPTIRAWMDNLLEQARRTGYVETLLGRRRRVPELNSTDNRVRVFAENAALNTPVQGSAADIIKRAMLDLERELTRSALQGRMLLQVHDELVLECPARELADTQALVVRCMEQAVALRVPLRVEVGAGKNWLEAH
ncbi:MAG: DNA polymerase I [Planctomycetes bacterium]|nr:DNA polymerase I [Planctomycetota bacterium]